MQENVGFDLLRKSDSCCGHSRTPPTALPRENIYVRIYEIRMLLSVVFLVMHVVRRDRHDIAMDILRKATSRRKKTELMSDVGLSGSQAKQYLGVLIENGLLEVDKNRYLKTTKKGLDYLSKCGECLLFSWEKRKGKSAEQTFKVAL